MKIFLNDNEMIVPEPVMTLGQFAAKENIGVKGTAIAVNDRLVRKTVWDSTLLNDGDRLTVIKIAFGG